MRKLETNEVRTTFRHGDLRNALVQAGMDMARAGGPGAVVLREATRHAGVAPNAAYRHFDSQADLLAAVRSACLSRLAGAIEKEVAQCRPGRDPQAFARRTLRAVGRGYLRFALDEPGLFRTAFSDPFGIKFGEPAHTGAMGLNPFELLGLALDRMLQSGLLSPQSRAGAEYLAWSTVHGLALLVLEGPLRGVPANAIALLGERLVTMVERGLAPAASPVATQR